MKFLEKKFEF